MVRGALRGAGELMQTLMDGIIGLRLPPFSYTPKAFHYDAVPVPVPAPSFILLSHGRLSLEYAYMLLSISDPPSEMYTITMKLDPPNGVIGVSLL